MAIERDSISIQELHSLAEQLSQEFMPEGWAPVTSSTYTRVAHNATLGLYFKQFLPRSPAESIKARLRGSRATRARRNADQLRHYGFDAPQNRHWGSLQDNGEYLFMQAANGQQIDELLDQVRNRTRHAFLRDLGTFVGRLHATGFTHGDLRPGNVVAMYRGDRYHFTLLDNERNRFDSPPAGRRLLRNLMQLNMLPLDLLSQRDRLRFFRAWRRQMCHYNKAEGRIIALEAYRWAMQRMGDKNGE